MRSSRDLTPNFVWLPHTILNQQNFFDLHWLFHISLIPFAQENLIIGAKVAAVLFATMALLAAALIMRAQKVPLWPIWTVLIFGSSGAFVYRMSMLRDQSLSLTWMLISVYLMFKNKEKWLLLVSLTYVWLYSAYPLLIVIAAIFTACLKLTEGKWNFKPLLYVATGILLGIIINPYFPKNLTFAYYNLADKIITPSQTIGIVEWDPYPINLILRYGGLAFLLIIIGIVAILKSKSLTSSSLVMLALSLLFGILFLRYQRFVEYFPVFALLFGAFATASVTSELKNRRSVIIFSIVTIALSILSIKEARTLTSQVPPANSLEKAANYLEAQTPKGSLVFQDYADFPQLFFYNTHNTYIVGNDPSFLSRARKTRFELSLFLRQGDIANVGAVIKKNFDADYIVWDLKNKPFLSQAFADPKLQEIFRDENAVVFGIKP